MKMGSKIVAGFIVVFALIPLVSAVGAAASEDPGRNSVSADMKTEPAKLKIGLPHGYALSPEEIVLGFKEAYPNFEITIDDTPWGDFVTKLVTQIAAGTAPDVFWNTAGAIASYAARGACVDLSSYIERDIDSDDYSPLLFAGRDPEGHVWGVPHGINPIALAYNKALFDEAGMSYPTEDWTFQDMIDAGIELTQDTDNDGETDIWGLRVHFNITQGWLPFMLAAGGSPLDASLTEATFSDPKSIEGITAWYGVVNEWKICPSRQLLTSSGGPRTMAGENKLAMWIIQANEGPMINTGYPDLDWDVVMMPKGWDGSRSVVTVANNWAVYSRTDKKTQDAAWEWLKYWLGDESQNIQAERALAGFPVKKTALELVEANKAKPLNKQAYTLGMLEYGVTMFENSTWDEWKNEANKIMLEVFDGSLEPAEACEKADRTVQAILDSANE